MEEDKKGITQRYYVNHEAEDIDYSAVGTQEQYEEYRKFVKKVKKVYNLKTEKQAEKLAQKLILEKMKNQQKVKAKDEIEKE